MIFRKDKLTIWDRITLRYYAIVPYEWRPKEVWYNIKCFAWKRYTTVKPRTLGHTWCDKTNLIPHVLFEMLCDFVETELRNGRINWDAFEDQAAARDEMEILYTWWTETYQEDYPFCLPDKEYDVIENVLEVEVAYQQLLLEKCKRIIELSPYMWT